MTRATYSTVSDLMIGDVRLGPQYGDGTRFVEMAADDIDSQLGHVYVTPFVIPDIPENRPSILLLKRINNCLASGRLIMDMALGGEDVNLNAYGLKLYNEGLTLLNELSGSSYLITGAEKLTDDAIRDSTGPQIINEDATSLVEEFYTGFDGRWRATVAPVRPYSAKAI